MIWVISPIPSLRAALRYSMDELNAFFLRYTKTKLPPKQLFFSAMRGELQQVMHMLGKLVCVCVCNQSDVAYSHIYIALPVARVKL